MSKRLLNSYADFEDWFNENVDPYQVRDLQNLGIKSLVGGSCYSYATDDVFEAWDEEIASLITKKRSCTDILEIVTQHGARSKTQIKNVLVWTAVEYLACRIDVSDYTFDEDDWCGQEVMGDSHEV